jgi:hypothetical protein
MKMLTKMQQDASFYDASLEHHTQEIQALREEVNSSTTNTDLKFPIQKSAQTRCGLHLIRRLFLISKLPDNDPPQVLLATISADNSKFRCLDEFPGVNYPRSRINNVLIAV